MIQTLISDAGDSKPRRLCVYNGGFLTQPRLRRILGLAGWKVILGIPGDGDWVGVWGNSPTSGRGRKVAEHRHSPVLRVEDAFLRSMHPGRLEKEPPIGLLLDETGVHFDAASPSDLETLLATHPLDDSSLLARARAAMTRLRTAKLSKYSFFDPNTSPPDPGYVLVIDQALDDASVRASGGDKNRFAEMLYFAQTEHPHARILIRSHPETTGGARGGYFSSEHLNERVHLIDGTPSVHDLLEGAVAVYTLSSQLGFEAILAGHKPRVFGTPFYAGWNLTEDEHHLPRRGRNLTRAQLFAAAMLLYPTWYDPYRDALCDLDTALDGLEGRVRAAREDQAGWIGHNIRAWKRPHMQAMFGSSEKMRFDNSMPNPGETQRPVMSWGGQALDREDVCCVEDGFIRSCGLGAKLVPPISLAVDDLGIYYDPSRPSRLEKLIADSAHLPDHAHLRAERLIKRLQSTGITKYNLGGEPVLKTDSHTILVPGQVEDDASVLLGCHAVRTNLELLQRTRAHNPDARIVYKPHPDVVAGLRPGAIKNAEAFADEVVADADMAQLLDVIEEVWTLTSLTGFEALIRGRPVTCIGAPFYAGWGLTRDLGVIPARRNAQVSLTGLVHAALIAYPRYYDPVTRQACPVEVAVDRLAEGISAPSIWLRVLARLQRVIR